MTGEGKTQVPDVSSKVFLTQRGGLPFHKVQPHGQVLRHLPSSYALYAWTLNVVWMHNFHRRQWATEDSGLRYLCLSSSAQHHVSWAWSCRCGSDPTPAGASTEPLQMLSNGWVVWRNCWSCSDQEVRLETSWDPLQHEFPCGSTMQVVWSEVRGWRMSATETGWLNQSWRHFSFECQDWVICARHFYLLNLSMWSNKLLTFAKDFRFIYLLYYSRKWK